MSFWSCDAIKALLGGKWLVRPAGGAALQGVSTDSRSVEKGNVFVALRGEKFDGHAFVAGAVQSGAGLCIVDREACGAHTLSAAQGAGAGVLLVEACGGALLRLAQAYRRTLTATKVIAVGGSNGKTTTVRLIESVLRGAMQGRASVKSFNNAVGVPLTILGARATDQYLICEVGTNAPGEIATLASVVEPDIAVITSLGREHLEGLGTIEGVAREEASLVGALRPGGCAIVADEPLLLANVGALLRGLGGARPRVLVSFGSREGADLRVVEASQSARGVTFSLQDRSAFTLPLLGLHNAHNAAAAVGVARRLVIETATIRAGLASAAGPAMRLERVERKGVTFINDAYNANPESMGASLETFSQLTASGAQRRVLVLGDMLELGEHAGALHAEVGNLLARADLAELIVLVGTHMGEAAQAMALHPPRATVVRLPDLSSPQDAHAAGLLREGDVVLLKGSRGMGLERVIGAWEGASTAMEAKGAGGARGAVAGDLSGGAVPAPGPHAGGESPQTLGRG